MRRSRARSVFGSMIFVILLVEQSFGQQGTSANSQTVATVDQESGPSAASILRQASDLAFKLEKFRSDRALIDIAHVQMWAEDFQGARKSILGSPHHHRHQSLKDLAEALARHGQLEEAYDVVRVYESGDGSRENLKEKV